MQERVVAPFPSDVYEVDLEMPVRDDTLIGKQILHVADLGKGNGLEKTRTSHGIHLNATLVLVVNLKKNTARLWYLPVSAQNFAYLPLDLEVKTFAYFTAWLRRRTPNLVH